MNCPECGAVNKAGAGKCVQCGALLARAAPEPARPAGKVLHRTDFLAAARANRRATRRLVFSLLAILVILGYLCGWSLQLVIRGIPAPATDVWFLSLWGVRTAFVLLTVGAVWSWVAFHGGDRLVLSLTGAVEVRPAEEPVLHNVVEEMAIAAGIPRPRVFVLETGAMNAFATGMNPSRAVICVTRGLLNGLNREELQGVIGHEMGHIVNWDIRYATAVGVIVGLIALVSDGALRALYFSGNSRGSGRGSAGAPFILLVLVVFAALAPMFAMLVQFAVSRQREFLADATSVRLTRHPQGLISALEKLGASAEPFRGANRATQHMFIVNPFRNFTERSSRLYATHPPLQLRINRLRNLGASM
jgi:heat shock protein HtpX